MPTVPIIRILYTAVFLRSWIKVCDAVVRATDMIVSASVIKAAFCTGLAISAYFGYHHGFETLAWGVVLSTLLQALAMLALAGHKLETGVRPILSMARPGLILGLVTLAAAFPATLLGELHWLLRLLVGVLSAGTGLLAWAWWFPTSLRQGPHDLLAQIAGRIPLAALKRRWTP